MGKGRLKAFTDGVIAIIITIMVLEMKVPTNTTAIALVAAAEAFGIYPLSFANVGIFWNNHHHILQATQKVDGKVVWANLFLLFWLSLMPFAIHWMEEGQFQALPTAGYGVVLIMCGFGHLILERTIVAADPANSKVGAAIGSDMKAKTSFVLDGVAIAMAFVHPWIAMAIYILVAVLWFVPDRRVESRFKA